MADVKIILVNDNKMEYVVEVQKEENRPNDIIDVIGANYLATFCLPYKETERKMKT